MTDASLLFSRVCTDAIASTRMLGSVVRVEGLTVTVDGLNPRVGDVLSTERGSRLEVIALNKRNAVCIPLDTETEFAIGQQIEDLQQGILAPTGSGLLGRVIDGLGRPMDGKGPLKAQSWVPVHNDAPNAMTRSRVAEPLSTGVRVLDGFTTLGKGQRIGLFAGSGVGKSTLLSMIARGTDAPLSVICLVGERGREVREFIEDDLGPEGLARSVVVIATSDQPAPARIKAAFLATRIAESFRDAGEDVVLMMDSLTRVAMAQREIGLSAGEPPATRGYPPSMVKVLAEILERAGAGETGSITGIYTVLVDGDDHNDPVADAARSILDGHVVLDRKLAVAGHYPSVDALASISRVASKVLTPQQKNDIQTVRTVMAARAEVADLISVGAYPAGSNPLVDKAITYDAEIKGFLQQGVDEAAPFAESWQALRDLAERLGG